MANPPRPRLALGNRRKLRNPRKHLAALDTWAESFRDRYPERTTRPAAHWHLPADERLVSPPWAETAHQAHALKALLRAALLLSAARPPGRAGETVYVISHWPSMFMAEVGVFLDPAYARTFEIRSSPHQTWTRLPQERDLAQALSVEIEAPLEQHGYREVMQREADESAFETEVWIWREPFPLRSA